MKVNRILLLIDSLGSGGAQNQLTLLAQSLKRSGYQVTLVTYFEEDFFKYRLEETQIEHLHFQKESLLGLSVVISIRALIKQRKFDVVIAYMDTPNFYAVCATKWLNIKTIISYRQTTSFDTLSKLGIKLKKWTNKQADCIVCNSVHERKRWAEAQPIIISKLYTIYNGIDQEIYQRRDFKRANFLAVGTMHPRKNAHRLAEAIYRLREEEGITAKVDWYGGKTYKNHIYEKYVDDLYQLIDMYHLEDQFVWHEPVHNINEIYTQYEALIHPSLQEGLPNVICEALSCGTPVLASRILDHPVLVEEGKRGFLFDPYKIEKIMSAIRDFFGLSQEEKVEMGIACSTYAQKYLSLQQFTQNYEDLLQQ